MKYYKDKNNQVWAYEDDAPELIIKKDLTDPRQKSGQMSPL